MTDSRVGVLGREVLLSRSEPVRVDEIGREVLLTTQTPIYVDVVGREVLIPGTALGGRANAADTISATFSSAAALSEAATPADTISASFAGSASLSEGATAADTISATWAPGADAWSVSLSEAASAGDTISAVFAGQAALSEHASAADTISASFSTVALGSLSEHADPADTLTATFNLSGLFKQSGGVLVVTAGTGIYNEAGAVLVETGQSEIYKEAGAVLVETAHTAVMKLAGAALVERTDIETPLPPVTPFEPLFPPNVSMLAVGGCGWRTRVALTTEGQEYRSGSWQRTLGRWTVSHNLRTPIQVAELEAFHRLLRGKYGPFRLKDWLDYTVVAGEGVLMTTPLGFVILAKQYIVTDLFGVTYTALRPITRPRPFTVVFDPLGPILDYFSGYVTGGAVGVTTWTGEFDVPVRFEADQPQIEKVMPTGSGWRGISFVEVRSEI